MTHSVVATKLVRHTWLLGLPSWSRLPAANSHMTGALSHSASHSQCDTCDCLHPSSPPPLVSWACCPGRVKEAAGRVDILVLCAAIAGKPYKLSPQVRARAQESLT